MRYFRARLWDVNSSLDGRRWLYVPYDQLSDGPLTLLAGNPHLRASKRRNRASTKHI